jgi:hypothetical protein
MNVQPTILLAWLACRPASAPPSPAPAAAGRLMAMPESLPADRPRPAPSVGPVAEEANRLLTEALGMSFVVCPKVPGWNPGRQPDLPSGWSDDTFWFAAPGPRGASCRGSWTGPDARPERMFRWFPEEDGRVTCVDEPVATELGEVRAIDADGRPVAGIHVSAVQDDLLTNAETDAAGVARIELCGGQPVEVDLMAAAGPLGSAVVRAGERVDKVIEEGHTVQGDLERDQEALTLVRRRRLEALRALLAGPDLPEPVADVLRADEAYTAWLIDRTTAE